MKIRRHLLIVLSLVPSLLILAVETHGFDMNHFMSGTLFLIVVILPIALWLLFDWLLIKPTQDFLNTIRRAINGDYRARFSCDKINESFYLLSQSFNKFMSIVEEQTDELMKSRYLQNQLYENETIYRSALELTCERLFEADLTHNKLIYGQEVYNRTFSFLKTELYDEIIKSIAEHAIHDDDKKNYLDTFSRAHLLDLFSTGDATEIELEYRQKFENGEIQWMAATLIHLTSNSCGSIKVIGYVKNIDQHKRHELEILKQSQKDGLTTLYNKKMTQSLIEAYLSCEGSKSKSAVIMLDIDNFKNINDTLGHIQGDAALSQIGEKLQNLFRSVDIVGRIGGDEFLIFINDYNTLNILENKLDLIRAMFKEIHLGDDGNYQISGSIGVSLFPEDGNTYAGLYQKADQALYQAKSHGKNCYYFCDDRIGDQSLIQLNDPLHINLYRMISK